MTLSRILNLNPADLFQEENREAADPVVSRITSLDSKSRTKVWNDLASAARARKSKRTQARQIGMDVEELLAQIDFLRAEIESVKRRMG
jgi:hypothetical protein